MMKRIDWTRWTQILIWASIAIISTYDLLPAFNAIPADTISEILRINAGRWWISAAAWGVLGGHFFGPFRWRSPIAMTLALLAYGVLGFIACWRQWLSVETYGAVFIIFIAHIGIGAVFWSQGYMPMAHLNKDDEKKAMAAAKRPEE